MDHAAFWLSIKLGLLTVLLLFPVGVVIGRLLAFHNFKGKGFIEALLALPLVLPPTVLGYYLLISVGGNSVVGHTWERLFGHGLVFHFQGLVLASLLVNLPFAIQPMQRSFAAIPREVREAGACSGLSPLQVLLKIDLPLGWPGIVTGMMLTFAHTLGEFGVVLMVGGSIPGETRTIAIAIYDRVQAFDLASAGNMAMVLLAFSLFTLGVAYALSERIGRRYA